MKLAIHPDKESGLYNLVDLESEPALGSESIRFTYSSIKESSRFNALLNSDHNNLMSQLTENQLMVAAYFYLKNSVPSRELVYRWMLDAGCKAESSEKVTEIIYEASVNNLGEEHILESTEGSISNHYIPLLPVLEQLSKGFEIRWIFDSIYTPESNGIKNISIANLKEALFRLEDHSCFIFGFANSCSSLIELYYGYDMAVANELCDAIPLGYRDRCSVGRALTCYTNLTGIISESNKRIIEYYGLDLNGMLRKYPFEQQTRFYLTQGNSNRYLPIYLRIYK